MTELHEHEIRAAFDELRASHRAPSFRAVLELRPRRRRVRRAALPVAAIAMVGAFLLVRAVLPGARPSIAEWRAPSDDLIQETVPSLFHITGGSSALNELLPVGLQIGGTE